MKKYIQLIIIPFIIISCSKAQNPILKEALSKIKSANAYNIKISQKMSFNLDTTFVEASPYVRFISKNSENYKSSKAKFLFYESINSDKWFDLTVMDGNNWHIASTNNKGKQELESFNLKDDTENNNSYENFKSNFSRYSILFYPNQYFYPFDKWELISDEKINKEDTWLFEHNFRNESGFNVKYKINISKADTFLSRFTIICSEYEKLHDLLEVFLQVDILSHITLGEDCDTIFDIKKQIQMFNNDNKKTNISDFDNKLVKQINKDTAGILLNTSMITMKGDSIKLSSIKGKWILVDFWYVGCYPCYKAMDFFNKMDAKYKDKGLVIYGINPIDNDRKALSRLFNDKGLTYQYLIDSKGSCRNNIGISGFPRMFLISPDYKIVWQHYGYTTSMDAELEKIIEDKITRK